jgi:hypothetical protein
MNRVAFYAYVILMALFLLFAVMMSQAIPMTYYYGLSWTDSIYVDALEQAAWDKVGLGDKR